MSQSRPDRTWQPRLVPRGLRFYPFAGLRRDGVKGWGEGYDLNSQTARKEALAPTPPRPQSLPETLSEKYRVPTPSELGADGAAVKQSARRPSTSAGHHQLGFPGPRRCRTQTRDPRAQEICPPRQSSFQVRRLTALPEPPISRLSDSCGTGGCPAHSGCSIESNSWRNPPCCGDSGSPCWRPRSRPERAPPAKTGKVFFF